MVAAIVIGILLSLFTKSLWWAIIGLTVGIIIKLNNRINKLSDYISKNVIPPKLSEYKQTVPAVLHDETKKNNTENSVPDTLQKRFTNIRLQNSPYLYDYKNNFYILDENQKKHYKDIIKEYLELAQEAADSCNNTTSIKEFISSFEITTSILRMLSEHEFTGWFNNYLPSQNYNEIIEKKTQSEIDLLKRIYGNSPMQNIFEDPQCAEYESFFSNETKNFLKNGNKLNFKITENDIFNTEHFYNIPPYDFATLSHYERALYLKNAVTAKQYLLPNEMYSVSLFIASQSLTPKIKIFALEALVLIFKNSSNVYDNFIVGIAICMGGFTEIQTAIDSLLSYISKSNSEQQKRIEELFPFATVDNLKYYIAYLYFINENHEQALRFALELDMEDIRTKILNAKIYREIDPVMCLGYLQELLEYNELSTENIEIIQELANALNDIKDEKNFDLKISNEKRLFCETLQRSAHSFLLANGILK